MLAQRFFDNPYYAQNVMAQEKNLGIEDQRYNNMVGQGLEVPRYLRRQQFVHPAIGNVNEGIEPNIYRQGQMRDIREFEPNVYKQGQMRDIREIEPNIYRQGQAREFEPNVYRQGQMRDIRELEQLQRDPREFQGFRDLRERDIRHLRKREIKEAREIENYYRDLRDLEELRELKELKELRELRELKELRNLRGARGFRDNEYQRRGQYDVNPNVAYGYDINPFDVNVDYLPADAYNRLNPIGFQPNCGKQCRSSYLY